MGYQDAQRARTELASQHSLTDVLQLDYDIFSNQRSSFKCSFPVVIPIMLRSDNEIVPFQRYNVATITRSLFVGTHLDAIIDTRFCFPACHYIVTAMLIEVNNIAYYLIKKKKK